MSVKIQCPSCAAKYQLSESEAGQQVECACGQLLIVPDLPASVSAEAEPASVTGLQCPKCFQKYQVESELAGQTVECQCGQLLQVPESGSAEEAVISMQKQQPSDSVNHAAKAEAEPPDLHLRTVAEPELLDTTRSQQSNVPDRPVRQRDSDDKETQAEQTKSSAKSKAQQSRKKRQSSRTLLLECLAAIAAVTVIVVLYFVMSNGSSQSAALVAQKQHSERPREVAESSEPAQPNSTPPEVPSPEPTRTSLADRLKESAASESDSNTDLASQTPQQPSDTASATERDMPSPGANAGPANPYSETASQEFVQLSPSLTASAKPADSPDAKETTPGASSTPISSADPAMASPAVESTAEAATKDTQQKQPGQERIVFVKFQKRLRGFERLVKESLKSIAELNVLKQKATGGNAADKDAWKDRLAMTGGLLQATQQEIAEDSDPVMATRMRLLLAWCYLESHQYYEAGIQSLDLAMRTSPEMVIKPETPPPPKEKVETERAKPAASLGAALVDAELAKSTNAADESSEQNAALQSQAEIHPKKEATLMALTAFVKAYEQAMPSDRRPEYEEIVRVSELIHTHWPEHEKANDVRLYAAQLHTKFEQSMPSAKWLLRVTKKSPEYPRAQLAAGQIYYSKYISEKKQAASATVDNGSQNTSQTQGFRQKAEQYLSQGITLAADSEGLRDNLYLAKLTMAQLKLQVEDYKAAISFLNSEPHPLTTVIDVPAEETRPASGVRSARFAGVVFDVLVRACLGTDNTTAAIEGLQKLEAVSGEDKSSLARLYLTASERLLVNYHKAKSDGDEDLEILTAAAQVLQKVAEYSSGLQPASLLKAAQTTTQLADAVSEPDDAHVLFQIAADIYEDLVTVAPPENQRSLRYRMAIAMRSARRYEEALPIFEQMLRDKPNIFDLQFEAARTLQAWGVAEQNSLHLTAAVDGITDKTHVWGWRKMARTLQKLMTKEDAKPDYRDRFLEARNGIAQCRLHLAAAMEDKAMRAGELENAATEIKLLAMQTKSPESSGWDLLEASYHEILSRLGRPVVPLFDSQP